MSSIAAGPPLDSPLPAHDPTLETLRRSLLGTYDVERLLGAGGMGSVYLGRDRTLDRPVAIKVIAPELAASPALRERFLREARTVARLRHPHIVTVYAAGQARGCLYFVMEYVPGESLRERLARDGRFDDAAAVEALRDLARALDYAHRQGVVHRDVKPENVLLDAQTGRAMLTDFGVAALMTPEPGDGRMTGTGFVLGSPRYMSPEQAAGDQTLDGRSDLYSLGLVGYEMYAGAPAVDATSGPSMLLKQVTERPPSLASRSERVPAIVADVVMRALEKSPEARWPSGDAMAAELDRATRDPDAPSSERAAVPRAPRHRWLAGLAAAFVVVAALAGWWTAWDRGVPRGVDPRRSYLVAPFDVLGGDSQLEWLREGAVSMLTLDLSQWRDLQVVDYERGLDLQRDLRLPAGRPLGLADAVAMARRAGVWTVVMGQITSTPDSLLVDARVYDVATGRKVSDARQAAARDADPRIVFDALARDLLDLAGAPPLTLALAKSTTSSVAAYRLYLEGLRAMNAWQLARADSLLDAAIVADSTFALAYYKRAVALGWRSKADSEPTAMLRRAEQFSARLSPRERALIAGSREMTLATATAARAGSDSAAPHYAASRAHYAEVLARDSSDAEAWYGLADAYFHDISGGMLDSATVARWTHALAAFNRTLSLDSAFHLAYSHAVAMYTQAAAPSGPLVLDGATLHLLRDPSLRRAFGERRFAEAKVRAQQLGVRVARAWVAADPVPQAYIALADAYAASGRFDSAAAVLAEGTSRRRAGASTLPFTRARYLAHVDPAAAALALRAAIAAADTAAMREESDPDGFLSLMAASDAAVLTGDLRSIDALAGLATAVQPRTFDQPFASAAIARWWTAVTRLASGVDPAAQRPAIDAGIADVDRLPAAHRAEIAPASAPATYVAYLVTRDPRLLATTRRWLGPSAATFTELEALDALARGDSARARVIARGFPSIDSTRGAGGAILAARWVARAEVYAALGDARRAVAAYELLDSVRLLPWGLTNPGRALQARSLAALGALYESLGERDRAVAAYARFIALWKDADPALQDQVRAARAAVARLRDATTTGRQVH